MPRSKARCSPQVGWVRRSQRVHRTADITSCAAEKTRVQKADRALRTPRLQHLARVLPAAHGAARVLTTLQRHVLPSKQGQSSRHCSRGCCLPPDANGSRWLEEERLDEYRSDTSPWVLPSSSRGCIRAQHHWIPLRMAPDHFTTSSLCYDSPLGQQGPIGYV